VRLRRYKLSDLTLASRLNSSTANLFSSLLDTELYSTEVLILPRWTTKDATDTMLRACVTEEHVIQLDFYSHQLVNQHQKLDIRRHAKSR
jgi:hypothetical protein